MLQLPLMLVVKKTWAMLLASTGAEGAANATEHAVSSAGPALADEPVGEAAEHTAAASATEQAVVPYAPQDVLLHHLVEADRAAGGAAPASRAAPSQPELYHLAMADTPGVDVDMGLWARWTVAQWKSEQSRARRAALQSPPEPLKQ